MGANKKRKAAATVGAVTLVAALVLTGTYAWNSISQTARNENTVYANPGGRLHDDWNAKDPKNGLKQVYVENFTKETYGTTPGSLVPDSNAAAIYVRVKLQTYMEFGEEAGVTQKETAPGSGTYTDMNQGELDQRNVKQLVSGTKINKPEEWPVYIKGQSSAFQSYFTMETKTDTKIKYLPTFNKNKESLKADINGTYQGATSGGTTGPFTDFVDYSTTSSPVSQNAYYYKKDGTAEVNPSQNPGDETKHYVNTGESHSVAETLETTKIITMDEWLGYDGTSSGQEKTGDYWIYDEDGWAYWASPLDPGTATGPLLTGVKLNNSLGGNCYYAINVTGEFASAGDWGKENGGTDKELGFYKNGITDNALNLLNTMAKTVGADWVDITATSAGATADASTNTIVVEPGATVNLTGKVTLMGEEITNQDMTWSFDTSTVTGNTNISSTTGSSTTLTIDAAETPKTLKVKVKPDANSSVEVIYKIKIAKPDTVSITNAPERIVPGGSNTTLTAEVKRKDNSGNPQNYGNQGITWSIEGAKNGSYINPSTGELQVPAGEIGGTILKVTAKSVADNSVIDTKEIRVTKSNLPLDTLKTIDKVKVTEDGVLEDTTVGKSNTQTITIDGVKFFVIAKKEGKALLLSEEKLEERAFFSTTVDGTTDEVKRNWWASSTIRSWLNGTATPYVALGDNGEPDSGVTYNTSEAGWLADKTTLKEEAIPTTINTLQEYNGTPATDTNTTTDKIFFLSEADIYGTTGSISTSDIPANYYTLTKTGGSGEEGVKLVAPNGSWSAKWDTSTTKWWWLRSPRSNADVMAVVGGNGALGNAGCVNTAGGVSPACWIEL